MADDPKKTGKADRSRVAAQQKHEVAYAAKKAGVKPAEVKAAVVKVGNARAKVETELAKGKKET
jgi:hypothetical protein